MPGAKWMDKEIELLKQMADAGYGVEEIHECLPHRGKRAIYNKAYALSLSLAGVPPEPDWEKARRFLEIRKG